MIYYSSKKLATKKMILFRFLGSILLILSMFSQSAFLSYAATSDSSSLSYAEQAAERQTLPIETNEIENWPTGPAVSAEAAVLMESDTGTILYGKNIDEELYPASTTKMLTCLIAAETCSMDEMVTFSQTAIDSVPEDGSSIGVSVGESMSMEDCLYAIMVASANEVATAVGEHIAGSVDAFADMMNEKAEELGCTNSHFVNCNGLFDEDHYTTAHDLALIARAFFNNDTLYRIGNTPSHHFEATATQPDDFYVSNKHKLITGEIAYDGIIGGKTGYTDEARQTLVTGCEQNGMRLICVVLKEESPTQFTDTVSLFDYGYQNFTKVNVADNDTTYSIGNTSFYQTGSDIFSDTSPVFYIDDSDSVILPNMASFDDLTSTISYDSSNSDHIADISYSYNGTPVGTASLLVSDDTSYSDQSVSENTTTSGIAIDSTTSNRYTYFVNVYYLIFCIIGVVALLIFIMLFHSVLNNRRSYRKDKNRWRRFKQNKLFSYFKSLHERRQIRHKIRRRK